MGKMALVRSTELAVNLGARFYGFKSDWILISIICSYLGLVAF